jgi:hypothetical protein
MLGIVAETRSVRRSTAAARVAQLPLRVGRCSFAVYCCWENGVMRGTVHLGQDALGAGLALGTDSCDPNTQSRATLVVGWALLLWLCKPQATLLMHGLQMPFCSLGRVVHPRVSMGNFNAGGCNVIGLRVAQACACAVLPLTPWRSLIGVLVARLDLWIVAPVMGMLIRNQRLSAHCRTWLMSAAP